MSVFAARMNPSSSDWLSLGDSRYGNELRHHQHQMQQQQQLLPAASSPRHVNPPATFRDTHYAGIIVKPDPDSVYHQRNGEPPLSVDESYRVAAARALSQRPVWQTSPNSYHLATHESRRPPSGLIDNSLGWPIDRQRFPDSPRDVAAVTSRPSIEEGEYRRSSDKEDFISERLSFHGGGRSPASDAGHGHWNRDNELRPQSPRPRLDSAVSDPYRTAPGRHRTSEVGGSVHLERSRESDDSEPGHYRPRQLLADFYRTRERAEPQRDTREERSEDGGGVGVEDRRWTKASSTYDGSPPADRESIEEANFYNGRRQTWPFASLQDHHHTIPAGRRRHPHSASAPGQYFDQVDQSLGRQQAAVAAAAAASPIVQLIQRYDQHGFTSSTDAVPPTSTSSGARADWVPLPWQSAITSDAAAAAVDSNSTSEMSASMSESGEFGKTYSCHICSYIGESKMEFDAHMRLHFDHRCPFCDYSSRTEGRLRCHIKTFHADGGLATTTGQVPLVADQTASKRKPKIITCQKCGFKAKEKEELWIHRRQQHMAADKVLECPRCPFATELRHHLEYHLRSHYGSRPYKCDKCTYRCYNQSMLNSHAKSHTNVYQFRCADCQFAAKYCHSLKVHLRQNPTHRAAPVLNEDGSVPTDGSGDFEVMSRRGRPRGPRASRRTTGARSRLSRLDMAQLPALSMPMSTSADTVRAVAPPAQYVADNARTQFSVMPNLFASSDDSRLSSSSPAMMDTAAGRMFQSEMRLLPTTAFGEFVAAGQASRHAGPFQTVSSPAAAAAQYQMRSGESARQIDTAAPYSSATPPFLPVHMEVFESSEHVGGQHPIRSYSPATCADRPLRPSVQSAVLAPASNYDDYAVAVVSPTMPEPEPAALPLDLTAPKSRADDDEPPSIRPEVSDRSSDDVTVYRRRRHYESWSRAHSGASRPQSDDPAARNRKDSDQSDSGASAAGDVKPDVAFAHARPEADNFSEPEPERAGPPAKRTRVSESLEESGRAEMESGSPASGAERSLGGGRYQCSHCEIEFFGSRVLHAMHMAFHGPADPFQCSQCGVTTADRVEFFLHLARVAHA